MRRFDDAVIDIATSRPVDAASLAARPDVRRIAPTPEHLLPFPCIAGFAAKVGHPLDVIVEGYVRLAADDIVQRRRSSARGDPVGRGCDAPGDATDM
jgi:hypothetical protein